MAGTFAGTFSDFDASVVDGVLRGSAKVASVQVKDPNLEAHLQSPDFFDAQRYPELTFVSRSIERVGGIDPTDDLAVLRGPRRDGAGEPGPTGASPAGHFDELPTRQSAAEHAIERVDPRGQEGVAAPGRKT